MGYGVRIRQPLQNSQIVCHLKHATEPRRNYWCIFFRRSHSNLRSKMEVADRTDEGTRKSKTHVVLITCCSIDCIE